MKERLISVMKNKYADCGIDDNVLLFLCNKMFSEVKLPKKTTINMDYYYYYYFIYKDMIDKYIVNEIKCGNENYELYMLFRTEYIVNRYNNLKEIKKIKGLVDIVLEECINGYTDESFDKQIVKKIRERV